MPLATRLNDGRYQINKKESFCELLEGKLPDKDKSFTALLEEFDRKIRLPYPNITREALSNCHGDWYEWLIAIAAWNYRIKTPKSYLALLLPNVSQYNVARLYKDELYNLIIDLRQKVIDATDVQLITSNPDFALFDLKNIDTEELSLETIEKITPDAITKIEQAYHYLTGKCDFEDIIGYASVKVSLRPDRRLQIPHEGSLMKAIYTHLQTRRWIIQPRGLNYYAISASVNEADKRALKTVATHSITTVFNIPQAAVDEVFEINSLDQCTNVFKQILIND